MPPVVWNPVILLKYILGVEPYRHVAFLFVEMESVVESVVAGEMVDGEIRVTTNNALDVAGRGVVVACCELVELVAGATKRDVLVAGSATGVPTTEGRGKIIGWGVVVGIELGADCVALAAIIFAFSAARVLGPILPTGAKPWAFWKSTTAFFVSVPKYPVGVTFKKPNVTSVCCSNVTSAPRDPMLIGSVRVAAEARSGAESTAVTRKAITDRCIHAIVLF